MNPIDWIASNDTGVSSKTIWKVMMGSNSADGPFDNDIPYDPADFGRCYRLLELFPEWKERLHEVSDIYPKWGPMVDNWEELTLLYEKEEPTGKATKLYDRMRELRDDCYIADGWTRTSKSGWEKKKCRKA